MKKFDLELAVGFFVLIGMSSLIFLSIKLGRLETIGGGKYILYAAFENAGGIKPGATVEIAGVEVGRVKSVDIDKDYRAFISITIEKDIKIQEDAIASIRTKGLIGEKYIEISPGGSENILPSGGTIKETEPAIDVEKILGKFVFGKI
ncbi:MAG: outer membrane lipid asymmetry maintenance protein MlaD [Thermodesulfovibrionales bacterium]